MILLTRFVRRNYTCRMFEIHFPSLDASLNDIEVQKRVTDIANRVKPKHRQILEYQKSSIRFHRWWFEEVGHWKNWVSSLGFFLLFLSLTLVNVLVRTTIFVLQILLENTFRLVEQWFQIDEQKIEEASQRTKIVLFFSSKNRFDRFVFSPLVNFVYTSDIEVEYYRLNEWDIHDRTCDHKALSPETIKDLKKKRIDECWNFFENESKKKRFLFTYFAHMEQSKSRALIHIRSNNGHRQRSDSKSRWSELISNHFGSLTSWLTN